jgi:TetR/AcrR family transcriptional regulator
LTRRRRDSRPGPLTPPCGDARDPSSVTGTRPGTEDSRRRILLSAIREFAESGYTKASTNAIVRDACTSKGLLFHYYGSKKDLYLAALEYSVEFLVDYFLKNLGRLPKDPVDRFVAWANLKVRMLAEEPLIYKITVGGIMEAPEEIRPELQAMVNRVGERLMPVFLRGIDFSGLRKGIDRAKAVQYILLVFGALGERYLEVAMNSPDKGPSGLPSAMVEIEEYADFLKHGLYRNPPE